MQVVSFIIRVAHYFRLQTMKLDKDLTMTNKSKQIAVGQARIIVS